MNITDKIFESLSAWGEHPAFIDLVPGRPPAYISASDFSATVQDITGVLKKNGIRNGFIVALFLNNSMDFISVFIALLGIGAKPVPVNMAFRKVELDEIFANADPHAVITEHDHLPFIQAYLEGKIVIQRNRGKLLLHDAGAGRRDPAELGDDIASVNYTYRGYGYPLGALVPHGQYLAGADFLEAAVQLERGERIVVILPMQHIYTLIGCVFLPLLYGVTPVISYTRNPLRLFEAVREHGIHHVLAVPEVYELFLKLREGAGDIPQMKAFLSGGSVLPRENYMRLMEEFNVDLIHGYGLTEFTPVSRNIRGAVRPGTIGVISKGVECRIDSPDANGSGEIMIKTKDMAQHYYKRPAETREAFDGGWFRTGDIGKIEDGFLVYQHEKKNTRKFKGNMVDLEEICRTLMLYPDIVDVQVNCQNNVLYAGIDCQSSRDSNFNIDLKKFLEGMLADYKIPRVINQL